MCSDLHLSHKAPIARAEKDWYGVMLDGLEWLWTVANDYDVPIICAGDIFDKWNAPPELISFAIQNLPTMYAIPGQHDLPYHRLDLMHRSAYWTLVQAGKIYHLERRQRINSFMVYPFPWGHVPVPADECEPDKYEYRKKDIMRLAVVHKYIWASKSTSYKNAPKDNHITNIANDLDGYNAAVFGDNHKGFHWRSKRSSICSFRSDTDIINCGTFFRRKIDERKYQPQIGLLHYDGTISPLPRITDDEWQDGLFKKDVIEPHHFANLLYDLDVLKDSKIDFKQTLIRVLEDRNIDLRTKTIIIQSLEDSDEN